MLPTVHTRSVVPKFFTSHSPLPLSTTPPRAGSKDTALGGGDVDKGMRAEAGARAESQARSRVLTRSLGWWPGPQAQEDGGQNPRHGEPGPAARAELGGTPSLPPCASKHFPTPL